MANAPLVSIFMFCKDRHDMVRRSIDSILRQSYPNIEIVVQDGASKDGTLEILQSYGDKIKLVSEEDSGPAEGFWRVLNRCNGEIIGSCASDEEYLPGVVERAVARMQNEPDLGAITCDGYITDTTGSVVDTFRSEEFSIVEYLFGSYCPFWPGSFFRRQALIDVGLEDVDSWTIECLEFEVWCRLGTRHRIKHFPDIVNNYTFHDTQLSNTPRAFHEHINARFSLIAKMFSKEGFFGENEKLLTLCKISQYMVFHYHVNALGLEEETQNLRSKIEELSSPSLRIIDTTDRPYSFAVKIYMIVARLLSTRVKRLFQEGQAEKAKQFIIRSMSNLLHYMSFSAPTRAQWEKKDLARPVVEDTSVYTTVADIFDARGQIEQALQMWERAESLNDPYIDSIACQSMLKSPYTTSQRLLEAHRKWADKHTRPIPEKKNYAFRPYRGDRKIKVAYHCTFWNSVVTGQLNPFIRAHDKNRLEVFGYSRTQEPPFITKDFDHFKVMGDKSDSEFIDIVRSDEIDILVELTGFSPGHRFSAMASRCAPVQISTFNHTGTTCVPNIDFVLADVISAPKALEPYFTETIYRLPRTWLCYSKSEEDIPPIQPPPVLKNGHITFGCFGSGGKINEELISLWARLLKEVPESIMFIRNNQLTPINNQQFMVEQFRRYDIGENRLKILGGTDHRTILENYGEVDITLDTFPYCGGNTVFESLWQGVPVISLMGDRIASRYGASILHTSGLPDLAVASEEQYIETAARLAADTDRLIHLRHNLRQISYDHGSGNPDAFARDLEDAYDDMLRIKFQYVES